MNESIGDLPLYVVITHAHFDHAYGNFQFDKRDLVAFKEYEIVGVPDGYVFDLGGEHEVELIFLPGHSCGHAGFLDKKNRIFFCGDDACFGAVGIGGSRANNPHAKYASV